MAIFFTNKRGSSRQRRALKYGDAPDYDEIYQSELARRRAANDAEYGQGTLEIIQKLRREALGRERESGRLDLQERIFKNQNMQSDYERNVRSQEEDIAARRAQTEQVRLQNEAAAFRNKNLEDDRAMARLDMKSQIASRNASVGETIARTKTYATSDEINRARLQRETWELERDRRAAELDKLYASYVAEFKGDYASAINAAIEDGQDEVALALMKTKREFDLENLRNAPKEKPQSSIFKPASQADELPATSENPKPAANAEAQNANPQNSPAAPNDYAANLLQNFDSIKSAMLSGSRTKMAYELRNAVANLRTLRAQNPAEAEKLAPRLFQTINEIKALCDKEGGDFEAEILPLIPQNWLR